MRQQGGACGRLQRQAGPSERRASSWGESAPLPQAPAHVPAPHTRAFWMHLWRVGCC